MGANPQTQSAPDYFDVDPGAADALNQGMSMNGSVKLPFSAPVFYWMNGNSAMKVNAKQFPPLYFGGWASDASDLEDAIQEYGDISGVDLVISELTNKQNKEYTAYLTRSLIVAPISYRHCWTIGRGQAQTRHPDFVIGARQNVQLLALLACRDEKDKFIPWGPVVLSAKGYQAGNLLNAAREWDRQLSKIRREFAPKVPSWGFYMGLGTYGAELVTESVGKGEQKSSITPIKLAAPKSFDRDLLVRLFVSKEGLTSMAGYLTDARAWLDAWKAKSTPAGNGYQAPASSLEEPDFGPDNGDEIPF